MMRRKKKKVKRKTKQRMWSSARADTEFSKWIRARDGKCLRCGTTQNLTCSHFWARNKSALRYEPDNCITLCAWRCHIYGWENEKQGEYRDFMLKRIGPVRYRELEILYYRSHITRAEAIKKCMELLRGTKSVEGAQP